MTTSLLEDAFDHHVWATVRVIEVCLTLSPELLETSVPGTYGTILRTVQHLVGSDSWYLFIVTDRGTPRIDEDHMSLAELKSAMEADGAIWSQILAGDIDPNDVVREIDDVDGYEKHAATAIRLAQALHHGTDHRSQICTALTTLGMEPPAIDVWDFGIQNGRVVEIPPSR